MTVFASNQTPLRNRRRAIMLMLMGLLAIQAATLGLFALSAWNDRNRSADAAAERAIDLSSQAATARVSAFTAQAEDAVALVGQASRSGIIGAVDDPRTARFLLVTLRTHASFDAVYIGYPDGSFVDVSRDDAYAGAVYRVKTIVAARRGKPRMVTARFLDARARPLVSEVVRGDRYDPRERPWYAAATRRPGTSWTDPYLFFSAQAAGITAAEASGTGAARVVVGVDLRLTELERFVDSLRISDNSHAVLIGAGEEILAGASRDAIMNAPPGQMPQLATLDTVLPQGEGLRDLLARARAGKTQDVTRLASGGKKISVALSPVRVGGETWVLAVYAPTEDLLGAEHERARSLGKVAVLGVLSLLLAIGVALAMRRPLGGLSAAAGVDPLTGLVTRLELEHGGERHFARAAHSGGSLSVLLVDVDQFKQINDVHGHGVGDDVLRAVADGLKAASRPTDLVGRYAGDEFVLVMPGAQDYEAKHIADRVVRDVGRSAAEHGVTVSVGAATLADHASFGELVAAADRALYRAKLAGRNTAVFDEETPLPEAEASDR